ncbi:hypothetical protein GX51_04563 [Blastomyces parvus]|uniref:Transmembrane protein n=1 Tax=Blastomyces parvus TaxID=2060905 RepID=A0A2B7X150_9EURO|nr:hypothetical protein GX51_04563 [Blastomyces parvus]
MASTTEAATENNLAEKIPRTQQTTGETDEKKPRSIKGVVFRLLFDLFCISWLAPTIILLYLNFSSWIIGSGVACRLPSYKDDCNIWARVPLQLAKLDEKDHEILGSLQIVAKALEVWFTIIAGSLILDLAILLALSKMGLPMGHFMTYLEFSSVTILWNPTFWASSRGEVGKSPWYKPPKLWLWAFLGFAVLLCATCNLMGPATAVLAIPTLGWSELNLRSDLALLDIPSHEPPSRIDSIPITSDSGCRSSDLQAGNYSCTDYFSSSVDELSAALWARSEWRQEGFPTMSPMIPFMSLTFTVNETDAIDGIEIDWMPSRFMLRQMNNEYIELWISRASPNFTIADDFLGAEWPLDRGLYNHYTNSLDVEMLSYGPILGVRNLCSTAANITEFNVGPGKPVRCYTRTSTSSPNTFRYHCIRLTSGQNDWANVEHYSHANFTLRANSQIRTDINVHSADKAFKIPSKYAHCVWDHERSDCDWDSLLSTKPNTGNWDQSVHFTEYKIPDWDPARYTVMCQTEFYVTMADYIMEVSPNKINTTVVNTETRLEARSINVHADWALTAWSVARGNTINATRQADNNLLESLLPLVQTPPPKTQDEEDAFETRWFYDQHKTMTLQIVSLIGHTSTPDKRLVADASAGSNPYRPLLTKMRKFRVWSYGQESRTFRMGAAVSIFGCLCVIARTIISLVYRLPQPSTLEVLTAALRYEYKGDLDDAERESHRARIPFGYARDPADARKKAAFRERVKSPPVLESRRNAVVVP